MCTQNYYASLMRALISLMFPTLPSLSLSLVCCCVKKLLTSGQIRATYSRLVQTYHPIRLIIINIHPMHAHSISSVISATMKNLNQQWYPKVALKTVRYLCMKRTLQFRNEVTACIHAISDKADALNDLFSQYYNFGMSPLATQGCLNMKYLSTKYSLHTEGGG